MRILSLTTNKSYDLAISDDQSITIKFPDTDYQQKQIASAILYLTAWDTTDGDTMAGLLQVTLANEEGVLTLKFNGQLGFLTFLPTPGS